MRRVVTVTVDRPLGSAHPDYPQTVYPVNYGYIAGAMAQDGEPQDAYILGVDRPVSSFTGELAAILHRSDDVEDKWVVVPKGMTLSESRVWDETSFAEQWFSGKIEIL
ncbi:MAG: inorganic pyrophosphatase [Oscillospiraceae bacterium]|nr:inorganic pyrophosphatase [Oscillospiraceae bacterium]